MRRIYRRSLRLLIWLGVGSPETEEAVDFIVKADQMNDEKGLDATRTWLSDLSSKPEFMGTWIALATFFGRPWFRRSWVVQEYVIGSKQRAIWYCGPRQLCNSQVSDFLEFARQIHLSEALPRFRDEYRQRLRHMDTRHHDLLSREKYDTTSEITREASVNEISKNTVASFVEGLRSFADLNALTEAFSIATENGVAINDAYLTFWLGTIRQTKASDPRDKIYSILGLLEDSSSSGRLVGLDQDALIVDYNTSVQDVYSSLVQSIVLGTRRLGILSACEWRRKCETGRECENKNELVSRSWTPDWTAVFHGSILKVPPVTTQLGSEYGSVTLKHNYHAAGETDAQARFAEDLSTMTVKGFCWDTVEAVSARFVEGSSSFVNPKFEAQLYSCIHAAHSKSADLDAVQIGFLRALLKHDSSSLSESSMISFRSWLEEIEANAPHNPNSPDVTSTKSSTWRDSAFLNQVLNSIWTHRRLLTTTNGSIGQGSHGSQHGDMVCILLGCPVPMVLRRVDDHCILLGEAYFHGIMFGETLRGLENGSVHLEEFELH